MTTDNKKPAKPAKPQRPSNGVRTEPGMTFADLSHEQRLVYFRHHEQRWKERYNQGLGSVSGNQTFTRGG